MRWILIEIVKKMKAARLIIDKTEHLRMPTEICQAIEKFRIDNLENYQKIKLSILNQQLLD